MLERLLNSPNFLSSTISFSNNIYLIDILDIIFISIMIYFALFFLKQTRSLLAVMGIGVIIVIYALAQIFNLYLTSLVLQSFFGIFLIILAIVFQDELRRFFEFLAALGTRQIKIYRTPSASSPTLSSIMIAVANLARQKTGALIVLQGKESLERHLNGGDFLDGLVSETVIESVFDTNSPGHDGAIIINKNRITRFGTQLPLSKNFKQTGRRGTRHGAALGLAEKTDSFVIIVSEEKGTISIAENGRLKELKGAEELEKQISRFLKNTFPETRQSIWENLVKKNSSIKLSALIIATLLWFVSLSQAETIQKDFTLPITYKSVPENLLIEDTNPNELIVTLEGRGQDVFGRLKTGDIEIIVNAEDIQSGINNILVEENFIKRPLHISILNITPSDISVRAQKYELFELPITLQQVGTLTADVEIKEIKISPQNISVLVEENTQAPETILTELIDISDISETIIIVTKLIFPENTRLFQKERNEISVTIIIK